MQHKLSNRCRLCNGHIGKMNNNIRKHDKICFKCVKKTPPDEYRCRGMTLSGNRCKKWLAPGIHYCKVHLSQEEE